MSTALCKKAIVEHCIRDKERIRSRFVPTLTDEQLADVFEEKNWKRDGKVTLDDGSIERQFDCRPFDDQLRAYVVMRCDVIVGVTVQDE